jgi:CubicO group peptidase (beta-lactamase class C family)
LISKLFTSIAVMQLRAATLREMQRVHWVDPDWDTTWGLGFNVANRNGTTWVRHGGHCSGYYTKFGILPKEELGIAVLTNAIGSDVATYACKAAAIVGPAVKEMPNCVDDLPARNPDFEKYVGVYDSVWGRLAIVFWGDGLASVDLDSRAVDLDDWVSPLKHTGEGVFRRILSDDDSLGEKWVFAVDAEGQVVSVTNHSNPSIRVR